METIAVYWEPLIRVYGFDIRKDTALLELDFRPGTAACWGQRIESLAGSVSGFIMLLLQQIDAETTRICLALKQDQVADCLRELEKSAGNEYKGTIRIHQPVDILFFHGPHFQDRYGIVDAVFQAIDPQKISLHAVGCTGTSVYLVVGVGQAEPAREMLAAGFTVPGTDEH